MAVGPGVPGRVRRRADLLADLLDVDAPLVPGVQEHWVALFRYDSMRHLEEWLDSAAREKLLADGRRHFAGFDVRTVGLSFSGWFRFGDGADGAPSPNWKQAMMVLLALTVG
ncbi:hypothetical protein BBK14_25230 [Parafrankia soli]|uniref:ABM domain-containing protein n=1 Tax=Parafrankia soli TaxID=2599596 RepID=A0A1S1PNJ3_9ACTN|nr:hypothetical protein [Parafrankia soli]OHV22749.1 hypothetical protein BBK14_25230 [Parafrankia soli]